MTKINSTDSGQVINYMARDYDSFKQAMIDLIPAKMPGWTDRSEADFGIVLIELFAYVADILSYYQDRIANESFLATAQERRSIIQHLRLIGYDLEPANPAFAELSLEFPNTATGTIQVVKGDRFSTKSGKNKKPVYFEYDLDRPLTIDLDELIPDSGREKGFKKFPSNYAKINELLGSSDGTAYQKYKLSHVGVNLTSIQIVVGGQNWTKASTLQNTSGTENSYSILIDNDSALLVFGDGIHGKIPENGKNIEANYDALLPGIPVKEGKTISAVDYVGDSDGSPNQAFILSHSPVIRDSIVVTVDAVIWNVKDTLVFSESDSQDYYIQTDENDITSIFFGDGKYGKIPVSGAKIEAKYRIGGGRQGNMGVYEITQMISTKEIPATAKAYNEKPSAGGEDREAISHALKHAPQQFRSRERAVTENDLIVLTKRRYKGCKARAKYASWNFIDLYFAPSGGGIATSELKREIRTYLDDKRMVATIVRVKDPTYVKIYIKGEIVIFPNFINEEITYNVIQTVKDLFKFENVDFAKNLYLSKVYEAIEAIDGVSYVNVENFNREDKLGKEKIPSNGVITMEWNEIPELKDVEIKSSGGY